MRRTRGLHRSARRARAVPGGRAGRLHQRRQIHPVQRADRRRGRGARPAVRHAGPDHARPAAAVRPAGHPVRHRRLHQRTAARTGGGLPRHAGGSGRGRRDPARARRRPSRTARRSAPTWSRCWTDMVADGTLDAGLAGAHDRGAEQGRPAGRRRQVPERGRRRSRSRPSPARAWPRCCAAIDARIAAGMELADYDHRADRTARGSPGCTSTARWWSGRTMTDAIHVKVRLLPADRARFERLA